MPVMVKPVKQLRQLELLITVTVLVSVLVTVLTTVCLMCVVAGIIFVHPDDRMITDE
jgi:hypothetical protein